MVAGREFGRDYWMTMTHVTEPEEITVVDLVFAEPVSYGGEVPDASEPCEGYRGPDEPLDPDDPCHDEPREYGTRYVTFSDVSDVRARLEMSRGEVLDISAFSLSPDSVENLIEFFQETQEQ